MIDTGQSRRRFIALATVMSAAHLVPRQAGAEEGNGAIATGPRSTPPDDITSETIAQAERLAGISFTPKERSMMVETIIQNREMFESRREGIDLPDTLFPATVFNPLLPGRQPRPTTDAGDPNVLPSVTDRPAGDEDLDFASIAQLSHWLRTRTITSLQLTRRSLQRLRTHGEKLRCVITLMEDQALEQARKADAELDAGRCRGPLHGIPWGAKDLFDTDNAPTTWGAAPYSDRQPDSNAAVIERLNEAGAVLVAKLSLGALAYNDVWFGGRTNNPWNIEEGSSGSSAGSAAATAAGLVGFTLGTETYGSIVSPSMRCGVTGLRPTFGRVPRDGAMALCWSLDKVGPIVRHVDDAAPVLAAINGASPGDPASVTMPLYADASKDASGLRVGYDPKWFADDETAPLERSAVDALRDAGCELVPIEMPDWPWDSLVTILLAEATAAFESLTRGNRDDELSWQDPEAWPNTFRQSWFIPAPELVQADRFRRRCMELYAKRFDDLDAMIGSPFSGGVLITTNCTGHPSLTVPVGLKESGSPHAVTLVGRLFDEGTLLRLGKAIESRCWPTRLRRPPHA